jgi:LTXXQ motif family protein
MRKIGTFVTIAALAAVASSPSPSLAFGLRLGPFYVGIPFFGHRHRHHSDPALRDEASLKTVPPAAQVPSSAQGPASQALMSPLLYPVLALPAVYGEIFSPSSSPPWPFSYDAILQTAFAKTAPNAAANAAANATGCPQPNRQSAVAERIRAEIKPTGNQMPQMQKLGGALGFASDYLAKACPSDIPQDPAARLQLMEWQIEKVAEALDFVRPPLQELEQSLNDTQRTRFGVPLSTAAAAVRSNIIAPACAAAPTRVDASIEQISLAVQPTDAQRDAMDGLKQAFRNAANELDANCPLSSPSDPLARLEAIEARLDATWRALVSIQTALADFETKLSAEQRVRFDATDFAAAQ